MPKLEQENVMLEESKCVSVRRTPSRCMRGANIGIVLYAVGPSG